MKPEHSYAPCPLSTLRSRWHWLFENLIRFYPAITGVLPAMQCLLNITGTGWTDTGFNETRDNAEVCLFVHAAISRHLYIRNRL